VKKLLILSLVVTAGSAHAIIIDDFTSGNFAQSISSGSWVGSQTGAMLGGERDTGVFVNSNPLNTSLHMSVGNGMLVSSAGVLMQAQIGLDYDGAGDETNSTFPFERGPGLGGINLMAGGHNAIRFLFRANDQPLTLTAYAITYNGAAENISTATMTVNPNQALFAVNLAYSSFSGNANFANIDRLVFTFDTMPSGDFALDRIETVPEPASMAALALGAAGIAARRRRRNS
jgi:hypothetical protein